MIDFQECSFVYGSDENSLAYERDSLQDANVCVSGVTAGFYSECKAAKQLRVYNPPFVQELVTSVFHSRLDKYHSILRRVCDCQ